MKRILGAGALAGLCLCVLGAAATFAHLKVPEPSGSYPVGRMAISWTDSSRSETHTKDPSDRREVQATIWYPAEEGSGAKSGYLGRMSKAVKGLVSSGELSRSAVTALRFVRDPALTGSRISTTQRSYPVILLSPGNATNAGFYASITEELASRGYVVVGVDHPYQVAAVELAGGDIAVYDAAYGNDRSNSAAKIGERVADIQVVLDRLAGMKESGDSIGTRLDLERVGIMGHSNGGIAAVEACRADLRLKACMNVDGQMAGGPFSYQAGAGAPEQPFLFLTKETQLHPVLAGRFEAGGSGTYRVVVPAAAHDHFTDGALFKPTLNPFARTPDNVIAVSRAFARAFFDHALLGKPETALRELAPATDVYVNVYPLGNRPSIPNEM